MDFDKEMILGELARKIEEGAVDEEVLPVLNVINSLPEYCTTSSCAGRVTVLELDEPGDKKSAVFLGKWHSPVDLQEFRKAYESRSGSRPIFLLGQAPDLHVSCYTLKAAVRLRNLGTSSGLKYSSIRSLTLDKDERPKKIVVELMGAGHLEVPLPPDDLELDEGYLVLVLDRANDVVRRGRMQLARLLEGISAWRP